MVPMPKLDMDMIWTAIGQVLFAILTACAKWLNVKSKKKQNTLIGEVVGAAAAGGMVFFLYMAFGLNVYIGFMLAGAFGLLGVKGIEALGNVARTSAGIPIDGKEKK